MNEGVMPTPSGNPGSSAGAQPTSGAPAPNEEQQVESLPFRSPSSGSVGNKEDRVPKERFQEVYKRMKEAEEKLSSLENKPMEVDLSRPGYDEQISRWRSIAEKSYGHDSQEFTNALNQMSALQAKAAASEMMEQFLQHQQVETAKTGYQQEMQQSWDRALSDFPELRDESSEFYNGAAQIWLEDESLQSSPSGMYRAAEIMFGRRARSSNNKPPALEGSRKSNSVSSPGSDDIGVQAQGALDALKRGDNAELQRFLTNNLENILYSDQQRG